MLQPAASFAADKHWPFPVLDAATMCGAGVRPCSVFGLDTHPHTTHTAHTTHAHTPHPHTPDDASVPEPATPAIMLRAHSKVVTPLLSAQLVDTQVQEKLRREESVQDQTHRQEAGGSGHGQGGEEMPMVGSRHHVSDIPQLQCLDKERQNERPSTQGFDNISSEESQSAARGSGKSSGWRGERERGEGLGRERARQGHPEAAGKDTQTHTHTHEQAPILIYMPLVKNLVLSFALFLCHVFSFSLALSVSLSLTHTHTQTHKHRVCVCVCVCACVHEPDDRLMQEPERNHGTEEPTL